MLAPSGASKTAQKDAYNHAVDPATWKTTTLLTNTSIEQEFEQNLAVFDVLDKGLAAVAGSGCGNALSYAGPPSSASYRIAADMLADDQLYIDTSKSQCDVYLALEIESTDPSTGLHTMCGGRTLTQDAIDVTYSVLAAGLSGLAGAPGFGPKIHDGWERMPTLE